MKLGIEVERLPWEGGDAYIEELIADVPGVEDIDQTSERSWVCTVEDGMAYTVVQDLQKAFAGVTEALIIPMRHVS